MTGLGAAFVRLAGRAASGLRNTLNLFCDMCGKQTVFKLVDESGGTETYKCTSCHVITKSYTVK